MNRILIAHAMLLGLMGEDIPIESPEREIMIFQLPDVILPDMDPRVLKKPKAPPWGKGSRESALRATNQRGKRTIPRGKRMYTHA